VSPRCEDPKLVIRVINFELVQPICSRFINVTDGQTDRQTDGQTDDLRYQYRMHLVLIFYTVMIRNKVYDTNVAYP